MSKKRSDQLFNLIKSLSKSEKRAFKLYVHRLPNNEDRMFLKLFEILDLQKVYDESEIFRAEKSITKKKLSNLKRHLYGQILKTLQGLNSQGTVDIQINQMLDFAQILYGKGLFMQSLKMLDRASKTAEKYHRELKLMEILTYKKFIESRHITRSRTEQGKVERMLELDAIQNERFYNSNRLSNLKIRLHSMYIQIGHVRDEADRESVTAFFETELAKLRTEDLSVYERTHLYQCYTWYYHMMVDFDACFKYAEQWVNLFEEDPDMKKQDPDLYMRGFHYALTSAFHLRENDLHEKMLLRFEQYYDASKHKFQMHSKVISFLYMYSARLNRHILSGTFEKAIEYVPRINRRLKRYARYYDPHRSMVFYYKIAWIYFCTESYDESIDYLNRVINAKSTPLREDIQYYSRLLLLLCHYEKNNDTLFSYLIPSTKRFGEKMKVDSDVHGEILKFLTRLAKTPKLDRRQLMIDLKQKLTVLENSTYPRPAFLYLDIVLWLNAKIERKPMSEIFES